jgi:hypothetical protein
VGSTRKINLFIVFDYNSQGHKAADDRLNAQPFVFRIGQYSTSSSFAIDLSRVLQSWRGVQLALFSVSAFSS